MIAFENNTVHEVAFAARDLDFFLYNTRSRSGGLEWVYWRHGVSAHAAANRLFAVRLLTDCEGRDLTYDFETGEYFDPEDHLEAGWIRPEVCLDHSGGVIVRFRGEPAIGPQNGGLAAHPRTAPLILAQLMRGSDLPIRVEIRSRLNTMSPWRNQILELRLKKIDNDLTYPAQEPIAVPRARYAGAGV